MFWPTAGRVQRVSLPPSSTLHLIPMSHLDAFSQHLKASPDLQARLREAKTEDALVERVLAEAEALGYSLSADEVR